MGLVQSRIVQTLSDLSSIGILPRPQATKEEIFDAINAGDVSRLSYYLHEYEVDLTAVDDSSGYTALHLAISQGQDEIANMLLEHAANDPEVLNAKDRRGFTPLMRACEMENIAMMQVLVKSGAGVSDYVDPWYQLDANADMVTQYFAVRNHQFFAAARILINAEADVSKAYEMAIEQLEPFAAKLYFEAGAQSLPIVENCIDKARWDQLKLIVRMGIIRPHHMVTVLENAVRSNNEQLTAQLVEWEQSREARPLVVRYALNHDEKGVKALLKTTLLVTDPLMDIAKMADRPEAERVAAMKIIVRAADDIVGWTTYHSGFTRSNLIAIELVDQLKAGNHEVVKLMIAAGVPTFDILTDSARSADIVTVQRLLNLGATVAPVLRHDGNSSKKWFVLLASAAIKDRILEPKRVNNEPKIRMLKAWLGCGDGVKKAARELLRDEVKAGRYDHVKVLIAGGVPITESLMDLGRTADRPTAIKVMRLEEDATSAKIDAASAINQLIANSKEFAAKGDDEAACAEQNAANVLAVALATFASISAAQVGSAN